MAVPKEIRSIPRPKNTVVIAYGRNKDKYAVKQRIGCKSVNGRKIPIDGPVIGHIIDGVYVEDVGLPKMKVSECDHRRWADVKLCSDISQDILSDLREIYDGKEALRTYIIALLRTLEPDIKDYELSSEYEDTWLSIIYPDVGLSKNTVSEHINQLGRTYSKVTTFMRKRVQSVNMQHHIAIDGTLKSDESIVNTFSDFSRKALKKNTKDMSLVYAYDIETREPVCCKAYPGNATDISVFSDFIESNNLDRGIIVADKGFSYFAAKRTIDSRNDLHFLIPLRGNSDSISKFRMYDYNSSVEGYQGLACRKERMFDGRFLYSFRDSDIASVEEKDWISKHSDYDPSELAGHRKSFGSIVFISDLDLDPRTVYEAYQERWNLEVMFRFYKDILCLDETRVHDDWSVLGTEFINFLSIIITCRLRKLFRSIESLKGVPYNHVLRKLRRASKIRDPDGNWEIRKITDKERQLLVDLRLVPKPIEIKNPRGRPKKKVA